MGTVNRTFWTAVASLFCIADVGATTSLEGQRVRYTIAEKAAPVETKIYLLVEDIPHVIQAVNPRQIYPVLVDKQLICHGHVLDELLHERYPHPALLDPHPVARAQQRAIANEIRSWYGAPPEDEYAIMTLLDELADMTSAARPYLFSDQISVIDIAAMPFIYKYRHLIRSRRLNNYALRQFNRESFQLSLTPQAAEIQTAVFVEEKWATMA